MKSQSWLAPLQALATSVRAAFSNTARSGRNTKRNTKDPRRGRRHAVGRGAALRRKAPASATAKPSSESSLAFGLFRIVAIVLFACGAAGAIEAMPSSGALPDSSASSSLTQSLKGFFTRLWSPGTSDAEKLGTAYIYGEDGSLLSETGTGGANSSGTVNYIYLPTPDGPMPIAAEINGQMYAVHSDHLNTPRRLTDSQGQVAWQWAYSAFGDEKPTTAKNRFANLDINPNPGTTQVSPVELNLRYPNHYADQESGLFENRDRFYNPLTGRYTQGDAFGWGAGSNRFIYALGDPLGVFDEDGLAPKKPNSVAPYSPLTGGTIKPSPMSGWQPAQIGAPGGARLGGSGSLGAGRGGVAPFCPPEGLGAAKAIPQVADAKLGNIVRDLYKGAKMPNPIGTGSTADAIRSELATGLPTEGRFHSQKGTEYIKALDNWLAKNPNALHYDRMTAESLKKDLANALGK